MQFEWRPGIGDPTVSGWLTVVAYFVAAGLSFRAANRAQFSGRHWQTESMFWACVTLAMIALGINKQLDLQSLITELARGWAKETGWYDSRRTVQKLAIGLMAAFSAITALLIGVLLRKVASEARVAALGVCFVLAFVVIRAASFHSVDALISRGAIGVSWNALLELPGILVIIICAAQYSRRSQRKGASSE